jgi:hypothetical protein
MNVLMDEIADDGESAYRIPSIRSSPDAGAGSGWKKVKTSHAR